MSQLLTRSLVAEQGRIVAAPEIRERAPTAVDRSFELPKALYGVTVGCYLAFLAVMATGLSSPGLVIPMAIFTIFIVAGFGLPALWMRMGPDHPSRQLSWSRFRHEGIATHTGRLAGGEAAVQVLILPVLILLWGCVVVMIAALV